MPAQTNSIIVGRFKRFSGMAGAVSIIIGCLAMVGWILNIPAFKSVLPGLATMKVNTALSFVLCGVAVVMLLRGSKRLVVWTSGAVAVITLLTLLEYIFNWNPGIDQWLIPDLASSAYPGRMSPVTAITLLMLSSAILLVNFRRNKLAQVAALTGGFLALLAIVGYLYSVESLYRIGGYSSIALHTATLLVLLSLAVLFSEPESGLISILSANGAGGILARRLLPAVILLPIVIGWLRLQGELLGWYDARFGLSLFAVLNLVIFSLLIGWIAFRLLRIDNDRLKAEKALRRSEAKFSTIFQTVPVAVDISTLSDGRLLDVNQKFLEIMGYEASEIIDRRVEDIGLWVNASQREAFVQTLRMGGSVSNAEGQWRTKSGAVRDMLFFIEPIEIAGEACLLAIALDITERKRAEAALHASEEQYRELFEANPHPMAVTDLETLQFLAVNDAALKHYGYSREEFLALTAASLRIPEGRIGIENEAQQFIQGEPSYVSQGVTQHLKKDGSVIAVEITGHRLNYNGRDAVVSMAYDLTERLKTEGALRRSEAAFSTIFQTVPVAISLGALTDGRIIDVNDYLLKLSGFTRGEVVGLPNSEVPIWKDYTQGADFNIPVRDYGGFSDVEFKWRTKAGHELDMLVSAITVDINGQACVLSIGVDITERKRTEQERLEAERMRLDVYKQREVVELKEKFISTMTHEFRTPLTLILSTKETLLRYADLMTPERRLEKLKIIDEQVHYVTGILDEVLTISKARSGRSGFTPGPMNLAAYCKKLFDQMQATDTQNHQFVFDNDGKIGEIEGDPILLQHILVNLLSNAMKYSPEGGKVRFELRREGEDAVMTVSDQGIGIPEEDQKHLFETFYRASNVNTIKGTGLGLAIVKEHVEAHQGTIAYESIAGQGTTFTVRVPISPKL